VNKLTCIKHSYLGPDGSPIKKILSQLNNLEPRGDNFWIATCSAHDHPNQALAIGLVDNGQVMLTCDAGCSVLEVAERLGVERHQIYPAPLDRDDNPPEDRILDIKELRIALKAKFTRLFFNRPENMFKTELSPADMELLEEKVEITIKHVYGSHYRFK